MAFDTKKHYNGLINQSNILDVDRKDRINNLFLFKNSGNLL